MLLQRVTAMTTIPRFDQERLICNGIDEDCVGITEEDFSLLREGLRFDGSNDYLNVGNWWNYQKFTVELWVKLGVSQVTYPKSSIINITEALDGMKRDWSGINFIVQLCNDNQS